MATIFFIIAILLVRSADVPLCAEPMCSQRLVQHSIGVVGIGVVAASLHAQLWSSHLHDLVRAWRAAQLTFRVARNRMCGKHAHLADKVENKTFRQYLKGENYT